MSPLTFPTAEREPAGLILETGTPYSEAPVRALVPLLERASIDVSREKPAEATLVFSSRREPDGSWQVQDSGLLDPDTAVRLLAAFGRTRSQEIVRGYVREFKVEHPENPGESTVTVVVQDQSLAADRPRRRRAWGADKATSDAAILEELVEDRYGLDIDPASGPGTTGLVVNQDATDAAFLRSRAEANGYDLQYERGRVYFGPPRLGAPTQPPILVAAGADTNCVRLDLETDGRKPDVVRVELTADDGEGGGTAEAIERFPQESRLLGPEPLTATNPDLADNSETIRGAGDDREALLRTAQAKVDELAFKTTASGELDGTAYGAVLLAGRTVRVEGIGPTNSGTYLVHEVQHAFDDQGYRQTFQLRRNARGDDGTGSRTAATGSVESVLAS